MMSTHKSSSKRVNIYDSELGTMIRSALIALEDNPAYKTIVAYTSDREAYPDGTMPFVDHHMQYLHRHPLVNPEYYMSNLRLQLRVR
jgi:hypothetical protein